MEALRREIGERDKEIMNQKSIVTKREVRIE